MGNHVGRLKRGGKESASAQDSLLSDQPSSSEPVTRQCHYGRRTLNRCLGFMDEYLRQNDQCIPVIMIGEAWLVLRGKRDSKLTSTLDYLGLNIMNDHPLWLDQAAAHAVRKMQTEAKIRVEHGWFSNSKAQSLPINLQQTIISQSLAENSYVINRPQGGLHVLAAPWMYVASASLEAIRDSSPLSQVLDAAAYLDWILADRGNRPVPIRIIRDGARIYNISVSEHVVERVVQRCHAQKCYQYMGLDNSSQGERRLVVRIPNPWERGV